MSLTKLEHAHELFSDSIDALDECDVQSAQLDEIYERMYAAWKDLSKFIDDRRPAPDPACAAGDHDYFPACITREELAKMWRDWNASTSQYEPRGFWLRCRKCGEDHFEGITLRGVVELARTAWTGFDPDTPDGWQAAETSTEKPDCSTCTREHGDTPCRWSDCPNNWDCEHGHSAFSNEPCYSCRAEEEGEAD